MISSPSTLTRRRLELGSRLRTDKQFSAVHLIGVCGTGMKALAELLCGMGCRVSGSDLQPPGATSSALEKKGLRIHSGHDGRFLPRDVDVVVYSPAVGPSNPERLMASRFNVPQVSYSEMLGLLMQQRTGVCLAGTHGKSTTSAMIASVLNDAGRSPSAVIGAELCETGNSGWCGESDLFVVESCEYRRSFLDLQPKYAAILDIEPDHFDYFHDFDDTRRAFTEFAERLPADGTLIVRADCPAAIEAACSAKCDSQTFSLQQGADWWAADLRRTELGTRFRVFYGGEFVTEISLPLPGSHNVLNALAAVAMCNTLGVPVPVTREGLRNFGGIRRRFEQVGSWRGIALVDDYAHHPTAVRATLAAARQRYRDRRIWCIFQPHQVSRTAALLQQFAESFTGADEVLISSVFAAREFVDSEADSTARKLAEQISADGARARFYPSLDQIIATLEDESRPGDVWITVGAGDINRVHHEFTRRLRPCHSSR